MNKNIYYKIQIKKYNIFTNVIKYTLMTIPEVNFPIIELYNNSNIQNQDINDF